MGDFIDKPYLETVYQHRDLAALTQRDGSNVSIIDDTVLTAIITRAEAFVKGYIQTKYTLPFIEVPEIVKNLASTMAIYYLYERKKRTDGQIQVCMKTLSSLYKI